MADRDGPGLSSALNRAKSRLTGIPVTVPLGLLELKATILLAPTIVALLRDLGVPAGQHDAPALRQVNLDLPQLGNNLFRREPLPGHLQLLRSRLIISINPAQIEPVRSHLRKEILNLPK